MDEKLFAWLSQQPEDCRELLRRHAKSGNLILAWDTEGDRPIFLFKKMYLADVFSLAIKIPDTFTGNPLIATSEITDLCVESARRRQQQAQPE